MTALLNNTIVYTPDTLTPIAGCSVVIGNFDGVHRGHQALIAQVRAARPDHSVVVLTFTPHPREYFTAASGAPSGGFTLTPPAQKERLLRAAGADHVIALGFDAALSMLPADDFITRVLVNGLGCAHVCVGEDFAFGKGRSGNVQTLRDAGDRYGFSVCALPPVCDDSGSVYSSSRVRTALARGDLAQVQQVLGRAWSVVAPVVTGDQRGRTIGYPTANQRLEGLQLPPYGIYAVRVKIEGEDIWREGVANLGIRPMFEVASPLLETYIFDFTDDIYGKTIEVVPVAFLRGEAKFDGLDALMAQIKQDCHAARAVLKSGSFVNKTGDFPMTTADATPTAACAKSCRMMQAVAAVLALIAADQLSKWWVFEVLLRVKGEATPFFTWLVSARHWSVYGEAGDFAERMLTPFANLVMVWNRGVSFGLFAGTGGQNPYILVGVAAVITAVLLWWLSRTRDVFMQSALVLIIAGAVANVHDRVRFGAVADFMDLHVAGYHWPAFNIADSAIVIGAVLLVLDALNLRPALNDKTAQTKG